MEPTLQVYGQFILIQHLSFLCSLHHSLTSTPHTLSISWVSSCDGPMWRLAKDSSGGRTSRSRSWRACADSESVLRQCGADKNRGSLLAARKANISTVTLATCAANYDTPPTRPPRDNILRTRNILSLAHLIKLARDFPVHKPV